MPVYNRAMCDMCEEFFSFTGVQTESRCGKCSKRKPKLVFVYFEGGRYKAIQLKTSPTKKEIKVRPVDRISSHWVPVSQVTAVQPCR